MSKAQEILGLVEGYSQSLTKKQIEDIYKVMHLFLVRGKHFTDSEAKFEIKLMRERLGDTGVIDNPESYLSMARIGATKRILRKDRRSILLSIENAINHGTYGGVVKR